MMYNWIQTLDDMGVLRDTPWLPLYLQEEVWGPQGTHWVREKESRDQGKTVFFDRTSSSQMTGDSRLPDIDLMRREVVRQDPRQSRSYTT